jgi:CRP/FNR family transcriptional regulator
MQTEDMVRPAALGCCLGSETACLRQAEIGWLAIFRAVRCNGLVRRAVGAGGPGYDQDMPCTQMRHTQADVTGCEICSARRLSVCASVADEGLRRLEEGAEVVRFEAGATLVRQGDPASHLFNITKGVVRVYALLADGRRQIVGFLFPGDLLGLASNERFAFEAEALEPVVACRFRKTAYQMMLVDLPGLEAALRERACHELRAAQAQMLLLGRKTALERLASFLTDLLNRQINTGEFGNVVRLPMTRAEIADYLGLTTETVSRAMTKLKRGGLIGLKTNNLVEVRSPEGLEELAAGA